MAIIEPSYKEKRVEIESYSVPTVVQFCRDTLAHKGFSYINAQ